MTLPLIWQPLADERQQSRLATILKSWRGTPYCIGSGYRGVGADCVRSTAAILCEWLRHPVPDLRTLPPDSAMHSRRATIRAFTAIRRALPPHKRVNGDVALPGDMLIVGPVGGGPGHAILVGAQRNTTFEMSRKGGFQQSGWSLDPGVQLFSVLRFREVN